MLIDLFLCFFGELMNSNTRLVISSTELQQTIISNDPTASHCGKDSVIQKISNRFFWFNIKSDFEKFLWFNIKSDVEEFFWFNIKSDVEEFLWFNIKSDVEEFFWFNIKSDVEKFFWFNIKGDVERFFKFCEQCQRKGKIEKKSSELHSIPIKTEVMQQVGINICSFSKVDGFKHLVVCK